MAEELKACPCCHQPASPYGWKSAGCMNPDCMLTGMWFDWDKWQNKRAQLPSQGGGAGSPYQRPGYDALWLWFSLSRSSYAVLPRVMMHDMPDAWQADMARLMGAWDDTWINQPNISCRVQVLDPDGKLMKTPAWMLEYRHPNREQLAAMKAPRPPRP